MNTEQTDKEFKRLISQLNQRQFWDYISSWKSEEALDDEMSNWETDTKKSAIVELKKWYGLK